MIAAATGWEEPDAERFLKNLGKHIKAGTTIEAGEEFFAACHEFLDNDEPLPARPPATSSVFCGFAELK